MESKHPSTQAVEYQVGWGEVFSRLKDMVTIIRARVEPPPRYPWTVYGVPRGGVIVAGLLEGLYASEFRVVTNATEAQIIVDDIVDSGATMKRFRDSGHKEFYPLVYKEEEQPGTGWVVFPWETESKEADVADHILRILQHYQIDGQLGTKQTPARVARFLDEQFTMKQFDMTVFPAKGYDEMIISRDIPFYTLCEHHLLPFFGDCSIGYIPKDKILGISKLPRLVGHLSKGAHTQEYLTDIIAEHLNKAVDPLGVAVTMTGRHLCQEMRGVKAQAPIVTTALRGKFMEDGRARAEFFDSLKREVRA